VIKTTKINNGTHIIPASSVHNGTHVNKENSKSIIDPKDEVPEEQDETPAFKPIMINNGTHKIPAVAVSNGTHMVPATSINNGTHIIPASAIHNGTHVNKEIAKTIKKKPVVKRTVQKTAMPTS